MSDLSLDLIPAGTQLPRELSTVTGDAARAIGMITDAQKQAALADKLGQALQGAWTVIIVRHSGRPMGLVAARPAGDNARPVFGHILPVYREGRKRSLKL
jgi:hypothetical protein